MNKDQEIKSLLSAHKKMSVIMRKEHPGLSDIEILEAKTQFLWDAVTEVQDKLRTVIIFLQNACKEDHYTTSDFPKCTHD